VRRGVPKWVVIDFAALLIVMLAACVALATFTPKASPPAIQTLGIYAIVATWTTQSDVDLYASDPAGDICYFAAMGVGQMHLEHDTIPDTTEIGIRGIHEERIILRGVQAGEYVANVAMYRVVGSGRTPVDVKLYRLAGADALLLDEQVQLGGTGTERTAFRFTLDAGGHLLGTSHLQRLLAYPAAFGGMA
jgi:hypothetical protein